MEESRSFGKLSLSLLSHLHEMAQFMTEKDKVIYLDIDISDATGEERWNPSQDKTQMTQTEETQKYKRDGQ